MSLTNILDICSSAMNVEEKKIEIHTNNIANSESIESKNGKFYPYKAKMAILENYKKDIYSPEIVRIKKIVNTKDPYKKIYNPNHPLSDSKGYLKLSNVNYLNETVNYLNASKRYQANLEIVQTIKYIILKTIDISK
ncbi:flagellar basal body rod protein FlgC [Buchnera aphidicola (Ceratovacuna keduensis)]|uniref:flagellar basal body rod protein FlgC n=1 Tax=Buchnera aphidicola TaxID=9 RepID=UPI0031B849E1